ncbi:MAG: class III extradiol dioxygenase subunit beta [Arenicellaceae bacterium]|nr:class III extradiol dioxygenase subunit beta [Arenicellaceae bacterium]
MAKIVGAAMMSHVPLLGLAVDHAKKEEEYFKPVFNAFDVSKKWIEDINPDAIILVYNDHASAFSLDLIPTFAIGCAAEFMPADEGFGRREVPIVPGYPELAWHIAQSTILDEFDITIVNKMDVDHGLTVPLSLMFGEPDEWPIPIIPLAVNVIQYPPPTGNRCLNLGKSIKRAVGSFPENKRVVIFGTGGMSHQLQGRRTGLINQEFDTNYLDKFGSAPEELAKIPHEDYLRLAGSEGIELVMWLVARGAMNERVREIHRHYHVPISNTAIGHLILENEI